MEIKTGLIEAGFPQLAELYEIKDIASVYMMMDVIAQEEIIQYSSLALFVEQLRGVEKIAPTLRARLKEDVEIVLEEFIIVEKESHFPYIVSAEGVRLYREAIAGKEKAFLPLAHFYREQGFYSTAYIWYELAAEKNDSEAIYWIGNYAYTGKLEEANIPLAYKCYKKAAQLGFADAINNLADMHIKGEYVEKSDDEAFILFKRAAELGVPESMYTVGYLYHHGRGVSKDEEQSKYWYHQSALNGDVFALNKMGHQAFAENDGEKALYWYRKAAEKQDKYGEYNVGFCYESGIGTEVDVKQAKYWYQKAALHGDEESKKRLDELSKG